MVRVKIDIIKAFRHQFGSKDLTFSPGSPYYLETEDPKEKEELIYMMSGTFPYRFYISIETSPELLKVISGSSFEVLSIPPLNPQVGRTFLNELSGIAYYWNGSAWVPVGGSSGGGGGGGGGTSSTIVPALTGDVFSSGFSNQVQITAGSIMDSDINALASIQLSKLEKNPLDRTNHIGSQLASTISDFFPAVRSVKLNELNIPTGNINLNSYRLVNVADPVTNQDGANKKYVDDKVSALGFVNPLPLNKGGTGIAATTNIEALNALEGIYSGRNLGSATDGARLFVTKTMGSGSTPSYLEFRRLKGSAGINITETGDSISFTLGGAGTLNINTDLTGYPLTLANGGTGATSAAGARINIGAIGQAQNTLSASTSVGNVFSEVIVGTDTLRFRSLIEKVNGGIDINQQSDRIELSVNTSDIDLSDLSGSIDLAGSQITGVLPISKGGTSAASATDARTALDVVRTAKSLGGLSLLGSPIKDSNMDLLIKGLEQGTGISLTSTGNTITISAAATGSGTTYMNVGTGEGRIYRDVTSDQVNLKSITEGFGINVTNNTDDITVAARARSLSLANHIYASTGTSTDLEFKGIRQGLGLTITNTASDIELTANVRNGLNVGTGIGQVFKTLNNGNLEFRTISTLVGSGLFVSLVGDNIDLQSNIASAANLGSAEMVMQTPVFPRATLQFRSIRGGSGLLTSSSTANEIVLDVDINEVGGQVSLFKTITPTAGNPFEVKTLRAGTGITLNTTTNPDVIEISANSNNKTFASIGTGQDVYKGLNGTVEEYKRINSSVSVEATTVADSIVLNSRIANVSSVGTGAALLQNLTPLTGFNNTVIFKTVKSLDTSLVVSTTTDEVQLDLINIVKNGVNVGSGSSQILKGINGENLEFRTLSPVTGSAITIDTIGDTIQIGLDTTDININSLTGYPLTIANGGTNATTAAQARKNLDLIYQVLTSAASSGSSIVGTPEVLANEGRTIRLKGVKVSDRLLLTSDANDLTIDSKLPIGGYGIDLLTTSGVDKFSTDIENYGAAGEDLIQNPNGLDADPIRVRKLKAGDGITLTTEATGEITIESSAPTVYSSAAIAPVEGPVGTWSYSVNHNLGLPSPFTQFIVSAIDANTGELEVPTYISSSSSANTAIFSMVTGGVSPGNIRFNLIATA